MSVITLKLKYELIDKTQKEQLIKLIKNYNSIYNLTYNNLIKNKNLGKISTVSDTLKYLKTKNNILLDSCFQSSACNEATANLIRLKNENKNPNCIFGGKILFNKRLQNKISKEEFKLKKLRPIYSIGQAREKSNSKFQIINYNTILFKPSRKEHFNLKLINTGKQYKKYLEILQELQKERIIPISYKLSVEHIYVSFELSSLVKKQKISKKIKNRIFSIDLNPNYIGYTVIDWKSSDNFNVIKAGSLSIKELLDEQKQQKIARNSKKSLYFTNKRHYEIFKIAHKLSIIANHYKCSVFSLEKLVVQTTNHKLGKNYNRLINNLWNRNKLIKTIKKHCDLYKIYFQEMLPEYSSFIGNMLYRKLNLPDYCLASIEISRRAYEFYNQYIVKEKSKEKNIVFLEKSKVEDLISQSLEELRISETWNDLKELYYKLRCKDCKFRVPLDKSIKYTENFNYKSKVRHYDFVIIHKIFKIS